MSPGFVQALSLAKHWVCPSTGYVEALGLSNHWVFRFTGFVEPREQAPNGVSVARKSLGSCVLIQTRCDGGFTGCWRHTPVLHTQTAPHPENSPLFWPVPALSLFPFSLSLFAWQSDCEGGSEGRAQAPRPQEPQSADPIPHGQCPSPPILRAPALLLVLTTVPEDEGEGVPPTSAVCSQLCSLSCNRLGSSFCSAWRRC